MTEEKIVLRVLNQENDVWHIRKTKVTKDEFKEITNTLGRILHLVERQEQERVFMNKGIRRVENTLAKQGKEIVEIKKVLKVS